MSDNVTEIRDHFVYRTYDAYGRLLYIGCTKRLTQRWYMHRYERPAMAEATVHCRLQGPYTKSVARTIERDAVRIEDPIHNYNAPSNVQKQADIEARAGER